MSADEYEYAEGEITPQVAEYVRRTVEVPVVLTFEVQCRPESEKWLVGDAIHRLSLGMSGAHIHYGGYDIHLIEKRLIDGGGAGA